MRPRSGTGTGHGHRHRHKYPTPTRDPLSLSLSLFCRSVVPSSCMHSAHTCLLAIADARGQSGAGTAPVWAATFRRLSSSLFAWPLDVGVWAACKEMDGVCNRRRPPGEQGTTGERDPGGPAGCEGGGGGGGDRRTPGAAPSGGTARPADRPTDCPCCAPVPGDWPMSAPPESTARGRQARRRCHDDANERERERQSRWRVRSRHAPHCRTNWEQAAATLTGAGWGRLASLGILATGRAAEGSPVEKCELVRPRARARVCACHCRPNMACARRVVVAGRPPSSSLCQGWCTAPAAKK